MKLKTFLPILVWAIFVLLGNYQIISTTQNKIQDYHGVPPFAIGSISNPKNLNFLLDRKIHTEWERTTIHNGEVEFFLEMKLTHFYDGDGFSPFPVNGIEWKACKDKSLPSFKAKLFLREAINVDKELRLPKDKLLFTINFTEKNLKSYSYRFNKIAELKKEKHYSDGIYIYTLEMDLADKPSFNDCFSDITIKEF